MHRRFTMLAVAGILLVTGAACGDGGGGGEKSAPSTTVKDLGAKLPLGAKPENVPVTRPADPRPVDVDQLPATARGVAQMAGLTDDERVCANDAIARTLAADPAIAEANGKLASVMGNSVVACTTPERLADVVSEGLGKGRSLSAQQQGCVKQAVSTRPAAGGQFLAAVLTADVPSVLAAATAFQSCNIDLTAGG
jgi:hypothetical protein